VPDLWAAVRPFAYCHTSVQHTSEATNTKNLKERREYNLYVGLKLDLSVVDMDTIPRTFVSLYETQ
jgi:hypothetical protein